MVSQFLYLKHDIFLASRYIYKYKSFPTGLFLYVDDEIVSFSTFINYLVLNISTSFYTDNVHWRKYTHLCQPCDVDYDFIGHQETMDEDSE